MRHGTARASPAAARAVLLAAFLVYLALSLWVGWRAIVLAPYSDVLDWLARWFAFQQTHDLGAYLLAPHNVHRIPLTFGLLGLDATYVGASGWLMVASGVAALGATAWLLSREAGRAGGVAGAVLAAMLVLMAGNLLDAAIPLNVTYAHGVAFAVLALCLAEPDVAGAPSWPRAVATILAAVLAAWGNAAGLVLWPVLVLGALRNRAGIGWLAALAGAGLAFGLLYLHGASEPATQSGGGVMRALTLGLSILGLPWARLVPTLGWTLGAAVLVLSLAAIGLRGGPDAPRHERLATRLILFSLMTVGLVAAGRSGAAAPFDPPLRYALFLAPLHVGLLILALPHLARLRAAPLVLSAAALLLVAQQLVMGLAAIRTADTNRELVARFRAGERTPQMAGVIHPDLDHAAAIYSRLDAEHLYQNELHLKTRTMP